VGSVSRRAFLARSGATMSGMVLAPSVACSSGSEGRSGGESGESGSFDPGDWASVRSQFRLTPDVLHFAAFILAPHPGPVAEAIARHRAGFDEDPDGYLNEHGADAEQAVRSTAAAYLGAQPDEIALTDSTTMGLGLLYGGLRLRDGQQVVATEHDFYSTHQSLALRAARTGASFRRIRLYDDPAATSVDEIVGRLTAEVGPGTRAVAVTWVHSSTGVKLPVRAVADALADVNAGRDEDDRVLLCVDGVHGLGVEEATVGDLGCDFLVAGTHKWLFGPRGTGIVWGRADSWSAVEGIIPPFEAASFEEWINGTLPAPLTGVRATPGGYHSFEHRWALDEAFRFHLDIGKDAVAGRTYEQATRLKEGLADVPGLTVVTPMAEDLSAGIVCAEVAGADPFDVVGRLAEQGISASVTPYRDRYVRFGPSIVTSPDEVDALVEALAS
jgi:selenocysteine lyase/cysteine desulfurase